MHRMNTSESGTEEVVGLPTTRSHFFRDTASEDSRESRWVLFAPGTVELLRSLGVPAGDREDLTHEALILLVQQVIAEHRPERGSLRENYRGAVKRMWQRLKRRRRRQPRNGLDSAQSVATQASSTNEVAEDVARGTAAIESYVQRVEERDHALAAVVHAALIDDLSAEAVVARLPWLSRSTVRRALTRRGAAHLSEWIRRQLGAAPATRDELCRALLAVFAGRQGNDARRHESRLALLAMIGRLYADHGVEPFP